MKLYKEIDDLPLYNYSKILDTGDLRYLIVDSDAYNLIEVTEDEQKELFKVWESICDQITDFVGISENMKQVLKLERTIAYLRIEMITKGDKSIETIINIKELELNQLKPKNKKSIDESVVLLEVFLKMPINMKLTSVKRYYGYINYATKK